MGAAGLVGRGGLFQWHPPAHLPLSPDSAAPERGGGRGKVGPAAPQGARRSASRRTAAFSTGEGRGQGETEPQEPSRHLWTSTGSWFKPTSYEDKPLQPSERSHTNEFSRRNGFLAVSVWSQCCDYDLKECLSELLPEVFMSVVCLFYDAGRLR